MLYNYKGEDYHIIKLKNGKYGAVKAQDVNDDMRLTRTLNGVQLHASDDPNEVMRWIKLEADVQEIAETEGIPYVVACLVYNGLTVQDAMAQCKTVGII